MQGQTPHTGLCYVVYVAYVAYVIYVPYVAYVIYVIYVTDVTDNSDITDNSDNEDSKSKCKTLRSELLILLSPSGEGMPERRGRPKPPPRADGSK